MVQKKTSCIAALLLPLYEDPDISDKVDIPPCEQCLKIISNHELYIRCTLIIPGNNAFIVKHGFLSRLKKNFEFKDSEDCYIVFFDSYKSINNMIAKYAQEKEILPELIPMFTFSDGTWTPALQRFSVDVLQMEEICGYLFASYWVGGLANLYSQSSRILINYLEMGFRSKDICISEEEPQNGSLFVWFLAGKPICLERFLNFLCKTTISRRELSRLMWHSPFASGYFAVIIKQCNSKNLVVQFDDEEYTEIVCEASDLSCEGILGQSSSLNSRTRIFMHWKMALGRSCDRTGLSHFGFAEYFKHELKLIWRKNDQHLPIYPIRSATGNPFAFSTVDFKAYKPGVCGVLRDAVSNSKRLKPLQESFRLSTKIVD